MIDAVAERYGFLQHTKISDLDPKDPAKPVSFSKGRFVNDFGEEIEVELEIWNDGLVADTRSSTNDTDAFLDDLLSWISTDFDLTSYKEIAHAKLYVSELWVHTGKSLAFLNPKLQSLVNHINSLAKEFSGKNLVFDVGAIGVWNDRTIAVNNYFSPFRFERAEQLPFAENRYYTTAPFRTADHIKILDELEEALGG